MDNDRWYKIINKAMQNGYEPFIQMRLQGVYGHIVRFVDDDDDFVELTLEQIIFCHNFAKALWGEELVWMPIPEWVEDMPATLEDMDEGSEQPWKEPIWQQRLKGLVLANDYLMYIESTL